MKDNFKVIVIYVNKSDGKVIIDMPASESSEEAVSDHDLINIAKTLFLKAEVEYEETSRDVGQEYVIYTGISNSKLSNY